MYLKSKTMSKEKNYIENNYPLCNEPIVKFESMKQNKELLTNLFKGFGEAYALTTPKKKCKTFLF